MIIAKQLQSSILIVLAGTNTLADFDDRRHS